MTRQRFYEILPATLSWGTIVCVVVASWVAPLGAAVFIILFDTYWLLKTVYLSLHLRASFKIMRANMLVNWRARLEQEKPSRWEAIRHLVIIPMASEPYEIIHESFMALAACNYPKENLIVVLGREERITESDRIAERIREEFGSSFGAFLVTAHPDGLSGEIRGKGSNEAWAAREAQARIIDHRHIPYADILVSVFDADTQVLAEYFGILTHAFLSCAHPQRSSFQPVPLFTNNIFQAPALARVIAFSSSFWHMIQQSRPERLTTFSSHSMPFAALVEVGFWNRNIVSEDSQIFWQCFIHYNGDWRVEPIFYPVSMDANAAPTFWATMRNLYKQQRRWAWGGCENIPYFLTGFHKNKNIPRSRKLYWTFHYIEGFHSWATNALIIFSLGWLPVILGGPPFNFSTLSYNLPRITRVVMNLSMLGIVSSAILGMILLPPKPAWFRRRHYALYVIQWILMPLNLIIFGSFPALDAQTRSFIGGRARLGFWITPKFRSYPESGKGSGKQPFSRGGNIKTEGF